MSGGALNMTIEKVREDNLFEKLYKERKKGRPQGNSGSGGQTNVIKAVVVIGLRTTKAAVILRRRASVMLGVRSRQVSST